MRALKAVATMRISEDKSATGKVAAQITYPQEVVNALRAGFSGGRVYTFEIHVAASIGSDSGGTIQAVVSWDPSVSSFVEWSALTSLFDECLYGGSRLDLATAFSPSSTAISTMMAVAPDPRTTATNFTSVQRLAQSRMISCVCRLGTHSFTHRALRGRPWASTAVPGGAAGTPAGMFGRWAIANLIPGTPSINYLFAALRVRARLRVRA